MREWTWTIIAALETLGGMAGVLSAIGALDQHPANAWNVAIIVGGACLYGLSLVAGVLLFRGHAAGRSLSILVQATQIIQVTTGPLAVLIRIGAAWVIGFRGGDAAMSLDIGSEFHFSLGNSPHLTEVMVNLLACLALYALLRGPGPHPRPSASA